MSVRELDLRELRDRIGSDPTLVESFTHDLRDTIRPAAIEEPTLPPTAAPFGDRRERLVLGEVLGKGGMSIVYGAVQSSLGRRVAVKTVPAVGRAPMDLLREAWLTSELEHPNIVPVHEIESDADGRPLVVLRQIEGVPWSQLMHDSVALATRDAVDPLEWNLQVLGQVCRAVHFAHSRGVIHRDLKPDNVMVGSFGEVYLVDWGLAVSLVDDGSGRLPLARDIRHLAGTPGYMAPELLDGHGGRIGPRTDVYLLGAILYEMLSGRPPHAGKTLESVLGSVVYGAPPLPPELPAEIRQIAERALSPDPEGRFGSAEELRITLEQFLRHRGVAHLVDAAEGSTRAIETELAMLDTDAQGVWNRALQHYTEARFGYQQALLAWPDAPLARHGLERAARAIVEVAVRSDAAEAAATLVAQLERPPDDVVRRLDGALAERRAEREQLARQARENDPRVGGMLRRTFMAVLGTAFSLGALLTHWFVIVRGRPRGHAGAVMTLVAACAIGLLVRTFLRNRLTNTMLNRRMLAASFGTLVGATVLRMANWALGVPVQTSDVLTVFVWAIGISAISGLFERGLLPTVAAYWAAFAIALRWPETRFLGQAIAHGMLAVNGWVLWRGQPARSGSQPPL